MPRKRQRKPSRRTVVSQHDLALMSLCDFSPPCWHDDPAIPGKHIWRSLDEIVADWKATREQRIADCKAAYGPNALPTACRVLDPLLEEQQ